MSAKPTSITITLAGKQITAKAPKKARHRHDAWEACKHENSAAGLGACIGVCIAGSVPIPVQPEAYQRTKFYGEAVYDWLAEEYGATPKEIHDAGIECWMMLHALVIPDAEVEEAAGNSDGQASP